MFLPICKEDLIKRDIDELDFICVTGDAYVDHPSFGTAIISRVLESRGYKVGIIAQPDWRNDSDFIKLGKPKYGFLVSSGNIDSMVNHYTVAKKKRTKDVYSPGGEFGLRPDRAAMVYAQKIRSIYKNETPIILGGIEASLRRLSHYDYWDNNIKRSVLLDSAADLLIYGMGEHQVVELAEALVSGIPIHEITFLKGTVYKTKDLSRVYDYIVLPSYNECKANKKKYSESFLIQSENTDFITAKVLVEGYKEGYVVQNPPSAPLLSDELDVVYGLPYMRTYHSIYEDKGGVPSITEVKFSLINNRGCFGNCNFCALAFHQGRVVTARSHESIIEEAKLLTDDKGFKGHIHDVGGPTANFRFAACDKQMKYGSCKDKQCLFPTPCKNLKVDHKDYVVLLKKLRELPKIKKVFVRSGIRYDYVMADKKSDFLKELCMHHVSGQLKVAPEHISKKVLYYMGKPGRDVYDSFTHKFYDINKQIKKEQYLVPYLMSSHPGSGLNEAIELAEYLNRLGYMPEQVQDFYPTPGTLSTCIYYTETDPKTGEKVYVAKSPHEKAMQRALIQFKNPNNYSLVKEALQKAGREDLIGFSKNCLIRPRASSDKKSNTVKSDFKKKTKKTIRNIHKKNNS